MDGTLEKPVLDTGAEGASESNLSGKRTEFLCFSDCGFFVFPVGKELFIFCGSHTFWCDSHFVFF